MDENKVAIELKNVSKIYKLKRKDKNAGKGNKVQYFYALKNISLTIEKGQVVGVLGTNGSGKSTMSTMLAGISTPDEGEIIVNGEPALVAINTGLNKHLSGLENIELKGAMLGLSKKRIKELTEDVIEFAELGDFLYQPVKKYSSGMKSRLGFAINLCLSPDIIIVDEALSVGDRAFARKCMKQMTELKETGKTIIFVSHSLQQVCKFCDSAIWLEGGELKEYGEIEGVSERYAAYVEEYNLLTEKQKKKASDERFKQRVLKDRKISFWDRIFS